MGRTMTIDRSRDERGASAVEYALLLVGIALVIIGAVFLFGHTIRDSLNHDSTTIQSCTANASGCPSSP